MLEKIRNYKLAKIEIGNEYQFNSTNELFKAARNRINSEASL
ncbi:MAG: hypothetical protein ACP5I6_00945 [Caldisphaera sp.]|nr:hypothetical protein [Caldisphaera sp.]